MQGSLNIHALQHDETGVLNPVDIAAEELMLPSGLENGRAEIKEKDEDEIREEDEERMEHEASEARRKEEWEARQWAERKAEQGRQDRLETMNNDEVMAASMKCVSADTEWLA